LPVPLNMVISILAGMFTLSPMSFLSFFSFLPFLSLREARRQ
jgi:hypothetical protein